MIKARRVVATLVALLGWAVFAVPAAGAGLLEPSVPVWGIESIGAVVATRDTLSVANVILDIGYVGAQEIRFRFELDEACCDQGGGTPARFLADQPDTACATIGAVPTRVVECVYTRDIVVGQREQFSFRHKISRPAAFGEPLLWITVSVAGTAQRRGLHAQRVEPKADFVVSVAGPGAGRVGDIVEFTWSLTNVGLDPVWERAGMITFAAPAGTEFADSLADTEPDDMTCFVSAILQTRRDCWFQVVHPGQSNARKETWRLKILSEQVGEGKVEAKLSNPTGHHPEGDYVDPTPANNMAAIRVDVLPGVAAPGRPPLPGLPGGLPLPAGSAAPSDLALPSSADPSGLPSSAGTSSGALSPSASASPGGLALTGKSIGWAAAAVLAAIAILVAFLVARRRRSTISES